VPKSPTLDDLERPILHSIGEKISQKVWVPLGPQNTGPKTLKFRPDFGQLSDLTANNFGTEKDSVNRKTALNYKHSARWRCNLVYFGPLTKKWP